MSIFPLNVNVGGFVQGLVNVCVVCCRSLTEEADVNTVGGSIFCPLAGVDIVLSGELLGGRTAFSSLASASSSCFFVFSYLSLYSCNCFSQSVVNCFHLATSFFFATKRRSAFSKSALLIEIISLDSSAESSRLDISSADTSVTITQTIELLASNFVSGPTCT